MTARAIDMSIDQIAGRERPVMLVLSGPDSGPVQFVSPVYRFGMKGQLVIDNERYPELKAARETFGQAVSPATGTLIIQMITPISDQAVYTQASAFVVMPGILCTARHNVLDHGALKRGKMWFTATHLVSQERAIPGILQRAGERDDRSLVEATLIPPTLGFSAPGPDVDPKNQKERSDKDDFVFLQLTGSHRYDVYMNPFAGSISMGTNIVTVGIAREPYWASTDPFKAFFSDDHGFAGPVTEDLMSVFCNFEYKLACPGKVLSPVTSVVHDQRILAHSASSTHGHSGAMVALFDPKPTVFLGVHVGCWHLSDVVTNIQQVLAEDAERDAAEAAAQQAAAKAATQHTAFETSTVEQKPRIKLEFYNGVAPNYNLFVSVNHPSFVFQYAHLANKVFRSGGNTYPPAVQQYINFHRLLLENVAPITL